MPKRSLLMALLVLLVCMGAFMTLGAQGSWSFLLPFRGVKLLALLEVAVAVSISTVLFATITNNRILTPSLMGFDSLYVLSQTVLTFVLGVQATSAISPQLLYAGQIVVMVFLCTGLFRWLFLGSLHLVLLVGLVMGTLFRTLSTFLQRLLSPNDFVVLQDQLFASFNGVDRNLLGLSLLAIVLVSVRVWQQRFVIDVLALGREPAISLGLDYRREVTNLMMLIAVLVSVSTALVGPITFFGLLVANLAYRLAPSYRHQEVLPMACALGGICLVGGQTVLERVLGFDTALSIVVEFLGGAVFIAMLLKGNKR